MNHAVRVLIAEFLGAVILILFGTGVVAQSVLSGEKHGTFLSINLAWGLATTMGIYVAGGLSGAHLNPAVTLALAAFRGFSWKMVGPYIAVQIAGAFVGALLAYVTYHEAIQHFDGGVRAVSGTLGTAGIFATYPQPFLSNFPGGFVDQVVASSLLVMLVFAVGDTKNTGVSANFAPPLVGAIVMLIGMSFGHNCGYAINPARDLGPRLFTYLFGWGAGVFSANDFYFWVPLVGPIVGGLIGGGLYTHLIESSLAAKTIPPEESKL